MTGLVVIRHGRRPHHVQAQPTNPHIPKGLPNVRHVSRPPLPLESVSAVMFPPTSA